MKTVKGVLAAATVVALAFGSAACGSDSGEDKDQGGGDSAPSANEDFVALSAEEIKAEVVADMQDLESLSMQAEITSGGEQIAMDLALDTDGTCVGTMTLSGATAQILSVNGASYLKGDGGFWDATGGEGSGDMMEEMVGDRWAMLPAGEGGFESFCDLDALLEEFDTSDASETTVEKGEEGEFDSQPAIQLTSDEDGGTTIIWVATSGEDHYILSMERSGDEAGTITMSDFNVPVEVTEPAEEDVVDLNQLG